MTQEIIPTNPTPISPFYAVRSSPESSRQEAVEQFLYVIFRRKWLIAGLFVFFTVAATVAVLSREPIRSAVAKLLLKPDRMSLQISELMPNGSKGTYSVELINSELELIKSRDVLLPVAQTLLAEGQEATGVAPAPEMLEQKIGNLSKNLVASTMGSTSVIELRYLATTAEDAERILKMIVDQYLEHHAVAYSGSKQLITFYQKEKKDASNALEEAEEAFQTWQQQNDVVSIDGQITGLLQQLAAQQSELHTSDAGRQVSLQDNPLLAQLQGDLVTARLELNDLLARYTEQDRRVREKRAHIDMIQQQMASAKTAVLSSYGARDKALAAQVQQTKKALNELREKKIQGERMARQVDVTRERFLLYGKKLEEARISNQLSREQLSNVAVIEKPHATTWTDAEERLGTVLLAAIVGLTLGIVAAFVLAFFNKSLRTRQDVESYLGVPVLATIPQLNPAAIPDLRRNG